MPTDLPEPKPPTPVKRRPWALPLFITAPALAALMGYELLRPQLGHGQTDWVVVGLAGAGLLMVVIARATNKN
ncbi:MAG: hypothetical protein IT462_05545 [Planctomycetes bacterium]|nr:hypothetical protein [Planctomycetota bacterium]